MMVERLPHRARVERAASLEAGSQAGSEGVDGGGGRPLVIPSLRAGVGIDHDLVLVWKRVEVWQVAGVGEKGGGHGHVVAPGATRGRRTLT